MKIQPIVIEENEIRSLAEELQASGFKDCNRMKTDDVAAAVYQWLEDHFYSIRCDFAWSVQREGNIERYLPEADTWLLNDQEEAA